jgi:rhamnosyltransferase
MMAAVLISTYNGSKYIREQLDSILAQNTVAIDIYVRDDGSTDGKTREILCEYASQYSNFFVVFSKNIGVGNSFMTLLYSVPDKYEYYAFSDQDDIWDKEKISVSIETLEKTGALLYASNQECVNKNGISQGLRYEKDCRIHLEPIPILEKNMLAGCTMVFSGKLYKLLTEEGRRPSSDLLENRIHDVWVAMIASLYQAITYDERAFMKYRQHENNVVGAYEESIFCRIKQILMKIVNRKLRNGRSMLAREVCFKFHDQADHLLQVCANSSTLRGKLQILKHNKEFRCYTKENRLSFFIKVMLGFF